MPPDLKARADADAAQRGISLAELVRQALEHQLDSNGERGPVEIAGHAAIEALRAEGYTVEK